MKIDGIDYCVMLLLEDENGDFIEDYVFNEFDQMNEFIRSSKHDPKFTNHKVHYTLVESVGNGEVGGFSWTQEIPFTEFSEEDMLDAIEWQKDSLVVSAELSAEGEVRDKTLYYREDDEDFTRKIPRLKEFSYVCPTCIREIDDCRCKFYPYYLMQIDTLILPIIRELNMKGYRTKGCCAGHPNDDRYKGAGIYISFDQEYDFDEPIPENAHYEKSTHTLRIDFPDSDCNNMKDFQKQALWVLEDWAEMLSNLNEQDEVDIYD